MSRRIIRPFRSRSLSVCVNIFCEIPPILASRALLRIGASTSAGRISIAHLLAMRSSASRAEQDGS
jgi:hypothetical protein